MRKYVRPVPLYLRTPRDRDPYWSPPTGWRKMSWAWDDPEITDAKALAGSPLKGHVIVDVDDKKASKGGPYVRKFSPQDRLSVARWLRKEGELVASYHSKTWPDDPLHGHWVFKSSTAKLARRNFHDSGERIRPNEDWVWLLTPEGYRPKKRKPLRSLADAVGKMMRDSDAGELGGLNNLANEWAYYLAKQGASQKDLRALHGRKHRRTVESAWEKAQEDLEDEKSSARPEEMFVSARDLKRGPSPKPDLLDLIRSDGRTILAGDPETFKSWVVMYLAAGHCRNGGVVLYVDADMSERQMSNRLDLMGVGDIALERVYGYDWRTNDNFEAAMQRFREKVGDGPLLTIMDSGTNLGSGVDERAWETFLEENNWHELCALGGMVLIEHLGKRDKSSSRGSVGKKATVDLELLTRGTFRPDEGWVEAEEGEPENLPEGRLKVKIGRDRDRLHRGNKALDLIWTGDQRLLVKSLGDDKSNVEILKDMSKKEKEDAARKEVYQKITDLIDAGLSYSEAAKRTGTDKSKVQRAVAARIKARENLMKDRIRGRKEPPTEAGGSSPSTHN